MEYSPRDIPQWKQHRNKTKQKNPIHVDLSFIVFPRKLCYSSILTREPNWDWTKIWQLFYEIIKTLCTWLQKMASIVVLFLFSRWVVSDSLWPHGLYSSRLLLSMRFLRQEKWSGLSFPFPWDLPNPGIEPTSPTLAGGFFTIWASRKYRCLHQRHVKITNPNPNPNFTWH